MRNNSSNPTLLVGVGFLLLLVALLAALALSVAGRNGAGVQQGIMTPLAFTPCKTTIIQQHTGNADTIEDEGGYDPRGQPNAPTQITVTVTYDEVVDSQVTSIFCGRVRMEASAVCQLGADADYCRNFTLLAQLLTNPQWQPTPIPPTPYPSNFPGPITPTPGQPGAYPLATAQATDTPTISAGLTPTATTLATTAPTDAPTATPALATVVRQLTRHVDTLPDGQSVSLVSSWVATNDPCRYTVSATGDDGQTFSTAGC